MVSGYIYSTCILLLSFLEIEEEILCGSEKTEMVRERKREREIERGGERKRKWTREREQAAQKKQEIETEPTETGNKV